MNIQGSQRPIPSGFSANTAYGMLTQTTADKRWLIFVPMAANQVVGTDANGAPTAWSISTFDPAGAASTGDAATLASAKSYADAGDAAEASARNSAIATAISGKLNTPIGTTLQYITGAGTLVAFPTIPDGQIQSDWTQGGTSAADYIKNKPTLGTAAAQSASAFDAAGAAASAQAFAIQRASHTGTQVASTISDFSTAALLAVTWSTLSGKPSLATVATSGAYADLSGKPVIPAVPTTVSSFTNDSNYITSSSITSTLSSYATSSGLASGLAGKQAALTLTTTGGGAATLVGSTLNIPTPSIPAASTVVVNAPLTNTGTSTAANLSVSQASTSSSGVIQIGSASALDLGAVAAAGSTGKAADAGHVHRVPIISLLGQTFSIPILVLAAETVSTFTVAGATVGQGVVINPTSTATVTQRQFQPLIYAWVSSANTVSVAYRALLAANLAATSCPVDIHVMPHQS